MKTSMKISSSVAIFLLASTFAYAELAGNKGVGDSNAQGASILPGGKTGCPVSSKPDPKKAKACPKSLGSDPLKMEAAYEFEIIEYHPDTESYAIIGTDMPDEGDSDVTLEALAKSEGTMNGAKDNAEKLATLKKGLTAPCDMLHKKFKIKSIQTLSPKDLKERQGCVRK